MRDVVNCLVCHKKKKKASFQITQTIAGGFLYEANLFVDKDICQNCLKPESVVRLKNHKTLYVSFVPYKEEFVTSFWERCEFNRNDILSLYETTDVLIKEKLLTDAIRRDPKDHRKRGRDWMKVRDPRIIFPLDVPSPHDNNLSLLEAHYIKKSDLAVWIDRAKRNPMTDQDFRVCRRNKLSKEQIEKLTYLGYVRFDKDGLPKFGNDCINKKRVCLDCGDLKDFDDFYTHANGGITYTCLHCDSERSKIYYEENVDKLNKYNKKYRNSDRGKEREKFYRSKPENKLRRNLRKRLRDFMSASDNNYGKDISMTNKGLKAYIQSLFPIYVPDMTWDDYGSGKNGDHKDSWHIDHIIPLSGWDEFKYIHPLYFEGMSPNHWSNLRPLDALENISRGGTTNKKYYKRKAEIIDLEEINAHFLAMADLYPDKGFGPINWPIKLQDSQEEQKESDQLNFDLV